ncbi:MAG: hypothetical protein CMB56_002560 [Methanobacteriota archaeon]|nr:MAG: hypothetical protein CMB56_002560 [Euryarchaeota archaeon]|tara:strand:- start:16641 stop:17711 length:1071 start_codon:yes stop_codon:yes gene_type:complete
MAEIVALGCGLVGEFVISELIKQGHSLTVVGLQIPKNLEDKCNTIQSDALAYVKKIKHNSLVINMLPGSVGDSVRKDLLQKGINVIDLAFTIEDPREYNSLAIKNNCSLIFDVGIAPGFSNLIVADTIEKFGKIEDCKIRVGGIPLIPDDEWSYMAPFSPTDVIEEYERPARVLIDSKKTEIPATSDLHLIDYSNSTNGKIGTLQAFLTDGLRSLLDLKECKNMTEYTLRWPGHIEKFLDLKTHNKLDGLERNNTIEDLIKSWEFDKNKEEFTLLEVDIISKGIRNRWIIFDEGTKENSSMARTTGLVTLGFVDEILSGEIQPGVHAPENLISQQGLFTRISSKLSENGVEIIKLF